MDPPDRARRAQELVYEAWESDDADRRLTLGRRALALDPDCADAYLLLAEAAENVLEQADLCRQAVDAGRRSLGLGHALSSTGVANAKRGHQPLALGDYWLVLETRPYMRARYRLAEALARLGLVREAASHFRELCELNPADNQGARHRLAELLLELDEDDELAELLERYDDERSPVFFHYHRALLAYRRGEGQHANELLDSAVALNPHVPAYLWGDRLLPAAAPESFSLGGEAEAACYVLGSRGAWLGTAGALRWLQEIADSQRTDEQALTTWEEPSRGAADDALEEANRGAPLQESFDQDDALGVWAATDASNTSSVARSELEALPTLEGPAAKVGELLQTSISGDGTDEDLCARALELWSAYANHECPTIRKPAIHAAAFEYVFLRLLGKSGETQATLARRYGVSKSSLSRAAQGINDWIDRELAEPEPSPSPMGTVEAGEYAREALAVLPLDDETIAELSALPRVDECWNGALRPVPFQVMEPRLHRPTLALWYDVQHATILAQELYAPTVPAHALPHTLLQAFYAPLSGEPRLPTSVRVEELAIAEELGEALAPLGVEVEAGPLQAVGELMQSLESFLSRSSEASYLGGETSIQHVTSFFSATAALRRAASWTFVSEGQVLGLDLDRWGLGRVCVSVVGSSGFERGLLIFRELDDYLRYFRHAAMSELDGALVGAPVELLSLLFEHGAELEPSLRREVFKHGWEVVGPEDYPLLLRSDGGGGASELKLDDYRLATVCAEAVAVFCERHHRLFCGEERGPIRERVPLEHADGLESIYVVAPHPGQ